MYSTDTADQDKDQLYRLHVLMFHGDATTTGFAYILERQQKQDSLEIRGSYFGFCYQEALDYEKLHNDVAQIVKWKGHPIQSGL